MEKRQDKYDENPHRMTRTEKHQALYNEINSKIGYSEVSPYDQGTEIDLSTLHSVKPKREEYQKIKEYKSIIDDENEDEKPVEKKEETKVKNFDINAVLEEAKKNRKNDELEKKRNLNEEESVLSSLNKKYLHTKDFNEEDSDELKELIDTITSKTLVDDIKDEEEKELLSELLASTIDIKLEQELSNEEINKLYEDEDSDNDDDENDFYEESNDSLTTKLDNSFFTHSVEIKKEDLIKDDETETNDDDFSEEDTEDKHGILKIVVVSVIILVLVLLLTYFILKQMGF